MVVCFAECKGHDIEVSLAPAPVPNSFIPVNELVNVHILHFLFWCLRDVLKAF